jgi:hypothetical protein
MITLTTAAKITPERETILRQGLGQAIALIPGKSEAHLMLSFNGGVPTAFQGEKRDCAFYEVRIFGTTDPKNYVPLTNAICKLTETALNVSAANTYIQYDECANWGHNGSNL